MRLAPASPRAAAPSPPAPVAAAAAAASPGRRAALAAGVVALVAGARCEHEERRCPGARGACGASANDRLARLTSPPRAHAARAPGDAASPGLASAPDPAAPPFFDVGLGVKAQDALVGTGATAKPGDRVEIDFALRRANGYFIYSTVEGVSFQPTDVPTGAFEFVVVRESVSFLFLFLWFGSSPPTFSASRPPSSLPQGSPDVIRGLSAAVAGMRVGGRRRAAVPPSAGWRDAPGAAPVPPTFAGKRQIANHKGEPLVFELALLAVR